MDYNYWVQEWAKIRQDEVVRLPEKFVINNYFINIMPKADIIDAFKQIWNLYIDIYGDISKNPQLFGMPLYSSKDYNEFTKQARDSRNAPYRIFKFLYNLLINGQMQNDTLVVDAFKFKESNDVKNIHIFFERLQDYGFSFEGLKNFKIADKFINISYHDNHNVLVLLKLMADKARINDRLNDFMCCHYKLFQDDMNTINYGNGYDIVADKMHTQQERDFIYAMDEALKKMGYFADKREWNEGPGYAYYDKESTKFKKGPYHYWLLSWKTKLILFLRIRNASKCLDYLNQCPDSVKKIFLHSDTGCQRRTEGNCIHGQEYTLDGTTYWRCGCCNAPFHFTPVIDDIPHYIK